MTAVWDYDFGRPLHTLGMEPRLTDYVLRVARDFASPGSIGRELATLATTEIVTDELAGDIAATIRQLRAVAPELGTEYAAEVAYGIADLKMIADAMGIELDEDVR